MDLLTDRLIEHHATDARALVHRAKRVAGVLSVLVLLAYAVALWLLFFGSQVWAALIVATLAFLIFRQVPAVALSLARLPDRGRAEQAVLQRALDLAVDQRGARGVLRQLDQTLQTNAPPGRSDRSASNDDASR